MSERLIGAVTHYFNGPSVAVVHVTEGELHQGDRIHILGHTSDFVEDVTSMEVEHQKVQTAGVGDDVAVRVIERARVHDQVYKIVPG
jgi:putative protease